MDIVRWVLSRPPFTSQKPKYMPKVTPPPIIAKGNTPIAKIDAKLK